MAAAVSRALADGEVCFIGLGTGGRAFTYAVGIPSTGVALAQRRGLDVVAQYGVMIDAVIEDVPLDAGDPALLGWRTRSLLPVEAALDMFRTSHVDWGFLSVAQIDRYGNVNGVCIGAHDRPDVRLVGPIAQPDHAAYTRRTMIIVPQSRSIPGCPPTRSRAGPGSLWTCLSTSRARRRRRSTRCASSGPRSTRGACGCAGE